MSSTRISSTDLPATLARCDDLARREGLDVDVRRQLLEAAQHLEVVLVGQVGVLAADDVDLGDAAGERLARLLDDLVDREREGVGVAVVVAEGAEQAAVAADVGVVDVPVADEEDVVADGAPAGEVGQRADGEQVVALEEGDGVGFAQPSPLGDLGPDVVEAGARRERVDVVGLHGSPCRGRAAAAAVGAAETPILCPCARPLS